MQPVCECRKRDNSDLTSTHSYNFHWGWHNSKIAKDGIVSFGIPAFKSQDGFTTCQNASVCALLCYARQGRYVTSSVQTPREHNLAFLRQQTSPHAFIDGMVEDILHFRPYWTKVRIHDSGDFFTQPGDNEWYYHAWLEIARQCRHMLLYGYTKRISLLNTTRHLLPDNLRLVQSVGGLEDSLIDTGYPHSVIFPTHEALLAAGYEDASKSDRPAYEGAVKIGLVYHGVSKLKAPTADLLAKRNAVYLT